MPSLLGSEMGGGGSGGVWPADSRKRASCLESQPEKHAGGTTELGSGLGGKRRKRRERGSNERRCCNGQDDVDKISGGSTATSDDLQRD